MDSVIEDRQPGVRLGPGAAAGRRRVVRRMGPEATGQWMGGPGRPREHRPSLSRSDSPDPGHFRHSSSSISRPPTTTANLRHHHPPSPPRVFDSQPRPDPDPRHRHHLPPSRKRDHFQSAAWMPLPIACKFPLVRRRLPNRGAACPGTAPNAIKPGPAPRRPPPPLPLIDAVRAPPPDGLLLAVMPMVLVGLVRLWQPAPEPNGRDIFPVPAPITYTPPMRQPAWRRVPDPYTLIVGWIRVARSTAS
jgi:hypothetical protein